MVGVNGLLNIILYFFSGVFIFLILLSPFAFKFKKTYIKDGKLKVVRKNAKRIKKKSIKLKCEYRILPCNLESQGAFIKIGKKIPVLITIRDFDKEEVSKIEVKYDFDKQENFIVGVPVKIKSKRNLFMYEIKS